MNEREALETFTSGRPRAVDVTEIERELQHVWRSASAGDGESAILRASMLNFIVRVSDLEGEAAAVEAVARVSEVIPCRAFVLLDAGAAPQHAALEAWISSHCQALGPGGKQLCCEQITIRVTPAATAGLPSTLLALLVPDLPTVLWWPGDAALEGPLLTRLARHVDLLVIDSTQFIDAGRGLGALSHWARSESGPAVADVAWPRLDAWRELVAAPFDAPPFDALLQSVHAIEIEHTPGGRSPALLFAGWLGSRLGWTASRVGDAMGFSRPGGETRVTLTPQAAADLRPSGLLTRVVLRAGDETVFTVESNRRDPALLIASVDRPDACPLPQRLVVKPLDASSELAHVLGRPRRNQAFEDALHMAARLAVRP
jgi:glucose-6-phosphate dehydrogenase assembly protein OpcA